MAEIRGVIERYESQDYRILVDIWESAVKATHHFLKEEDFLFFKDAIPNEYLPHLEVYVFKEESILGFMAVNEHHLEMLFVDDAFRGRGIGKQLLNYAVEELGVKSVDVNEQNEQAVVFYQRHGFKVSSRTEQDSLGKDYPVLLLVIE
ncbi:MULTISPECIES: GNAT family N-acetyltransferase [Sphingobacterium]|uniref:GNAT family N-acetyltransferase n=1 Tax=Sphingobacterium TaxID=28453 RepID=UPI001FEA763C|nr:MULTISPECIES: GNAT family N-acetyltransferase [Sphingobacterium]